MGKQPRVSNTISENVYSLHRGINDLYKSPNRESLFPTTEQYKNEFPAMEKMKELQKKHEGKHPASSSCMRKRNAWVRNGLGTNF